MRPSGEPKGFVCRHRLALSLLGEELLLVEFVQRVGGGGPTQHAALTGRMWCALGRLSNGPVDLSAGGGGD